MSGSAVLGSDSVPRYPREALPTACLGSQPAWSLWGHVASDGCRVSEVGEVTLALKRDGNPSRLTLSLALTEDERSVSLPEGFKLK